MIIKFLEIYFNDLTPDGQAKYLEFFNVKDAEELNADIIPIFELSRDEVDWLDDDDDLDVSATIYDDKDRS